jgi:membrane fusion protein (multidrug efflux system)
VRNGGTFHLGVTLAFAGLAIAGCHRAAPAPPQQGPPEVTVVTLRAQAVKLTRELPGRARAFLVAEVRPQVGGVVKSRDFVEGSRVKAGQPLYQLDDAVYRADYESAVAALRKAEATRDAARLTAERTAKLRQVDAVSQQDEENAEAAVRTAEADVAAAQANVARKKLDIGFARISSPITGRVGISTVTPGALVTANQDAPLVTVQQTDPMYVDVSQSALEWLRLRRELEAGNMQAGTSGTAVDILLPDGTPYPHPGKLQLADVTVDPTTGSFTLQVVVPNPDDVLRPGMYLQAVVEEGIAPQAVLAPQRGITRDPKGNATALVVGSDDKVEPRTVHVSRTIGDSWLVESGLAPGDRVIVEGVQKVRPGASVKPVEASREPAGGETSGAAPATSPSSGAGATPPPSE